LHNNWWTSDQLHPAGYHWFALSLLKLLLWCYNCTQETDTAAAAAAAGLTGMC
jgi:hypothetical protein